MNPSKQAENEATYQQGPNFQVRDLALPLGDKCKTLHARPGDMLAVRPAQGQRGQELQRRGHAGLACHTCRTAPSRSAVHVLPQQRPWKEQAQEQKSLHSRKIQRGRRCTGRQECTDRANSSADVQAAPRDPHCPGLAVVEQAPLAWRTSFHDAGKTAERVSSDSPSHSAHEDH